MAVFYFRNIRFLRFIIVTVFSVVVINASVRTPGYKIEAITRLFVCNYWPEHVINVTCSCKRVNQTTYLTSKEIILKPGFQIKTLFVRRICSFQNMWFF